MVVGHRSTHSSLKPQFVKQRKVPPNAPTPPREVRGRIDGRKGAGEDREEPIVAILDHQRRGGAIFSRELTADTEGKSPAHTRVTQREKAGRRARVRRWRACVDGVQPEALLEAEPRG